jgi:hypothetical protein
MSYLYRPTPVMNPWGPPPPDVVLRGLRGGTMRGYQVNLNWKSFFDEIRSVKNSAPWIVKSGTMGRFNLGDDSTDDFSDLPLAPVDESNIDLSVMPALPVDLYPMSAPIAPAITPYTPGTPPIISSGGGIPTTAAIPGSTAAAPSSASSTTSLVNSLTSLATSITKAATGQINPTIPPLASGINTAGLTSGQQSLVAQAVTLQQEAANIAATNPSLAATYTAEANSLLQEAGATSTTNFFTESTLIAGMQNWEVFAVGVGAVAVLGMLVSTMRGRGK